MKVIILGLEYDDIPKCDLLKKEVIALSHAKDILDTFKIDKFLKREAPTYVINMVSFSDLDECEIDMSKAFLINSFFVRELAKICEDIGSCLIHVSTDNVFSGEKDSPYTEDDTPHPINVYGNSKLCAEYFIRSICHAYYILRPGFLYGLNTMDQKGHFVELMASLGNLKREICVPYDQIRSPTSLLELFEIINNLIESKAPFDTYHLGSLYEISLYDFVKTMFDLLKIEAKVLPVTSFEFGGHARKPKYLALSCKRLEKMGIFNPKTPKESLFRYLKWKYNLEIGEL